MQKIRKKLTSLADRWVAAKAPLDKDRWSEFNKVNHSDEEVFQFVHGLVKPMDGDGFLSDSEKELYRVENFSELSAIASALEREEENDEDASLLRALEKPTPLTWADMVDEEFDLNDLLLGTRSSVKTDENEIVVPLGCPPMVKILLSDAAASLGCTLKPGQVKWVQKVDPLVFDSPKNVQDYVQKETDPSLTAGLYTIVQLLRGCMKNAAPVLNRKAKQAFQFEGVLQAYVYLQNRKDEDLDYFVKGLNPNLPESRDSVLKILVHIINEECGRELLRACETLTRKRINKLFKEGGDAFGLKSSIILSLNSVFDKPQEVYQKMLLTKSIISVTKVVNPKTKKEERIEKRREETVIPLIRSYGVPMTPEETKMIEHLNKMVKQDAVISEISKMLPGDFNPYDFCRVGKVVLKKIYAFTDMVSKEIHKRKDFIRNAARELQNKSEQRAEKDLKPLFYSQAELNFNMSLVKSLIQILKEVLGKEVKTLNDVFAVDTTELIK